MTPLSPDQFARNLIRQTVTPKRVGAVMAGIAGTRIEVGPLHFGPGGAVTARGVGTIGSIHVTPVPVTWAGSASPMAFDAAIPGELTIDLTAGRAGRVHRYEGTVVVPLHITVALEAPAWVVLDVVELRASDVTVRLRTTGMTTFVLQTLGDADKEVAAQVAAVVNGRVAEVADLRRIDLAALFDRAWDLEMAQVAAGTDATGTDVAGTDAAGTDTP